MNIIVFGTSIAQGFDDTEMGGWVNRLFVEYSTRHKDQAHSDYHPVFNLSISGDTSDGIVKRLENELAFRVGKENLIIFEAGGNDSIRNLVRDECLVPIDRFTKNCLHLITEAKKYGKVVFLGTHDFDEESLNPIPWYDGHTQLKKDRLQYDEVLQKLTKEHDVSYVSMKGLLGHKVKDLTFDGDHPNAEGHQLIFERVKEVLEKEGIL